MAKDKNRDRGNRNQQGGGGGSGGVPGGVLTPMVLLSQVARHLNVAENDLGQDIVGSVGEQVFEAVAAGRALDPLDLLTLIPTVVRVPDELQQMLEGAIRGFSARVRNNIGEAPKDDPDARKEWYRKLWREMPASVMGKGASVSGRATYADALGLLEGIERQRAVQLMTIEDSDADDVKSFKSRLVQFADTVDVSFTALRGALQIEDAKLRYQRLRAMIKVPAPPPANAVKLSDTIKKMVGGASVVRALDPQRIDAGIKGLGTSAAAMSAEVRYGLGTQRAVNAYRAEHGRAQWIRLAIVLLAMGCVAGLVWIVYAVWTSKLGLVPQCLIIAGVVAVALYAQYLARRWVPFIEGMLS